MNNAGKMRDIDLGILIELELVQIYYDKKSACRSRGSGTVGSCYKNKFRRKMN